MRATRFLGALAFALIAFLVFSPSVQAQGSDNSAENEILIMSVPLLVGVDAETDPGEILLLGDVALWHLDENSSDVIHDETANNNDGTIRAHHGTLGPDYPTNSPTWTDNGKVGHALEFDGDNDYVRVEDKPSLNPESITVEAWAYVPEDPTDQQVLVSKWRAESGNCKGYVLKVEPAPGDNFKITWGVGPGGYEWGAWTIYELPFQAKWYHVVGTFDGSQVELYVDGVFRDSDSWTGSIGASPENLYLAREADAAMRWFKGRLDETRIYRRALTQTEVSTRYSGGEVDRENLIAEWKFENVDDGVAKDEHMWVDGKYGAALRFDGVDDYAEVPDYASLDIEDQITIEAWVYPRVKPDGHKVVASKYLHESNSGYLLKLENAAGGNFRVTFIFGDGAATHYLFYDAPFETRWWHVAGTFDGKERKLYVDGDLVKSSRLAGHVAANDAPVLLGAEREGWYYFDGIIDEVQISDFAKSQEEIAAEARHRMRGFLVTERNYYDTGLANPSWGQISWGETLPGNTDIKLYVATSDNAEIDDSTVALWHLDENSSFRVFDSTQNCNDGETYYSTHWADGKFAPALEFDNDGWVQVRASPSLNISGTKITLEAWAYPQGFAAGADPDWDDQVIAKGGPAEDGYYGIQILGGENNYAAFYLHLGENLGEAGDHRIEGSTDLQENTWYYIAGVYDGSKMRVYVNGVLDGEENENRALHPTPTTDLYLGRQFGGYAYFFDGIIDEVRISNVARSEKEIHDYYNSDNAHYAWDDWTGPYTDNTGESILSAPNRYIRWKAVLSSADGQNTPMLHDVTFRYTADGENVRVTYVIPGLLTTLPCLNPDPLVVAPGENFKLGTLLTAGENAQVLENRLENRLIRWENVFGDNYDNRTFRSVENQPKPPEAENMDENQVWGVAWYGLQAPEEAVEYEVTVSFDGDDDHRPVENTFTIRVTVVESVEATENVIDRKVSPLWSEPSVQTLLQENGLALPKENTRIGVTVKPIGPWQNVTAEDVHIWVRDMLENEHELRVDENENLGESLRFWATYDPDDDLPDNALGYFDVRVVVEGAGESDNRVFERVFQVADLDVVGSHNDYVQAFENQSLRGMATGIGRWELLEFACALDNLKENAFQLWAENVFYDEDYEITPDDIFLRLPPGGEGKVTVLLLSENLEGSWTGTYRAVPFVLDNEGVDPGQGVLENNPPFTYTVTAIIPKNSVLEDVFVYINGEPYKMENGAPENGPWPETDNVVYSYTWYPYQEVGNKENIGDHSYYFTATDGADNFRHPSSGAFSGPSISSEDFRSQYAGFFLENVDIYDNYYFDSSDITPEVYRVNFKMTDLENTLNTENKDGENIDNLWWAEFNMGNFGTNPELVVRYYDENNKLIKDFSFHPLVIQTPPWLEDMIAGVDMVYHTSETDENYWEIHVSNYPLPSGILTAVSGVSGFNIWEGIGDGNYGVDIQGLKIEFTLCSTQYDEWVKVWQADVGMKEVKFGKDWSLTPELDFEGGFFVCPEGREEIGDIELKVRFSGEISKEFPIAWFTIGPIPVEISAKPFVSADLVIFLGPDSPIEVERVEGSIGGGLGIYGGVNVVIAEGGVYGEVSGRVYFTVTSVPELVVDKVGLRGEFGVYVRFIFWTWEHALWSDEVWL